MDNNINKIVFEVYDGVLNMDYTKNEKLSIQDKITKLFRYFISGYIWQLKRVRKNMNRRNEFEECKETYDNLKIAIYTVSTGSYDTIKNPIYIDKDIDYFVFTNQEIKKESVWEKIDIPYCIQNKPSLDQARYIKTHPHEFFDKYDYSIFIDGNVRITCDIKPLIYKMIKEEKKIAIHKHQVRDCIYQEAKAIHAAGKASPKIMKKQMLAYKNEGFPQHFGLFETNIVIRDHNSNECKIVMNKWWEEMEKWTKRDQLSFTYSLWKNKFTSDDVLSLGNNSRRNPYFIVDSHR